MKLKRIIGLALAAVMSISSFSGLYITSSAAELARLSVRQTTLQQFHQTDLLHPETEHIFISTVQSKELLPYMQTQIYGMRHQTVRRRVTVLIILQR